jgi:hypothetical protein
MVSQEDQLDKAYEEWPDPEEGMTLTFSIVGPITVSMLDENDPNPDEAILIDVAHWIWSCKLQVRRFLQSLHATGKPTWRNDLERRRRFSRLSYDEHMVLVAAANLDRALAQESTILDGVLISEQLRTALTLLRNVYEHWNEQRDSFRRVTNSKSRSGRKLQEQFPQASPWSFDWHPGGDIVLAKVVSLQSFWLELRNLERSVRRIERRQENV